MESATLTKPQSRPGAVQAREERILPLPVVGAGQLKFRFQNGQEIGTPFEQALVRQAPMP
jgi:hypothetical protein